MNALTTEEVRAEVARYWGAFTSKTVDMVEDFYCPEATVFGSSAVRAEPGRLAATRRKREYFHPQTKVRVQVGPIEVQMIGADAAIATYTFEFHASKVSGALGKTIEEDLDTGRATQVFIRQIDGRLRVLHEHFSNVSRRTATSS